MALSRHSDRRSSVQPSTRATSSASALPQRPPSQSRSNSQRAPRSQSKSAAAYATLAPHHIHISQSKILKKWKPLPQTTQDRIRCVLLDVKNESKGRRRKAVSRMGKNGTVQKDMVSEEEWEGVIDGVVERLISRLPRMPFPPSSSTTKSSSQPTPSAEIDLETLLSRIALLRATLSSQNQSCKILKAQIKREQSALRREKVELRGLEDGVQRSKEAAARQNRNLHDLARTLDVAADADHVEAQQGLASRFNERHIDDDDGRMDTLVLTAARKRQKRQHIALTNKAIEQDMDLAPLVKQLRSHLSSMQSNAAGLTAVRTALGEGERAMMRLSSQIAGASTRRQ